MARCADALAERRTRHHEADVVVVGAGVFGCAIAFALADQGRSVLLLERWLHEPDRIVGELLQPGGVAALRQLGLAHCLEDIDAVPCQGYAVIYHGRESVVRYPTVDPYGNVITHWWPTAAASSPVSDKPKAESRRPTGRSFHHGRFISQLRRACTGHPNISLIESEVTGLVRGQHSDQVLGVEARTTDPATGSKVADYYFGHLTIAADGYASRIRRQILPDVEPVVRSKFYALELHDCPLPHPSFGHVVIGHAAAPVLLYQIGSHETRVLIDVPNQLAAAAPNVGGVCSYIRNVVVPALPADVRASMLAALDAHPGRTPRCMPNSWLPPVRARVPGLILLGDAANMRHPLTGGGMTVALLDAVLLARLLHPDRITNLMDATAVTAAVVTLHRRRKAYAANINVLAQALYALFAAAADDRLMRALQRGCFEYFARGVTDGPAGLLAGLIHRPFVLFVHFFTVALLALWIHAQTLVWPADSHPGRRLVLLPVRLVITLLDALLILWKACVVFLPVMLREITS